MKRWKIFTGIFLIFALGVVSGVLGTGLFIKHRILEFRGGAPFVRDRFLVRRLTRELDLTVGQQEKICRILTGMRVRHQDFFQARRSEITQIINNELAAIKKELTVEQQEKLDRLLEKLRRHRSRFHDNPPHQRYGSMDHSPLLG
ncbi:MAG: hypothetical protein JRE58_11335, partial [Deltaproteobacteria bacterium]|nr:hypothetical protein [Deltaproteobacteria bacterium]